MPILTAHSGSDGTKDNSLEFINQFIATNIDCIEIDVRKTNDQVLYLSHDAIEVQDEAVLLSDVFSEIQNRKVCTRINCDLKEENLERLVLRLADHYQLLNQVILTGTVNLQNIRREERENQLFYNIENIFSDVYKTDNQETSDFSLAKLIHFCKEEEIKVVNAHYRLCHPSFIQKMNEAGIRISAWTVNDVEEIENLFDLGVYNVTSRQALKYLREQMRGVD